MRIIGTILISLAVMQCSARASVSSDASPRAQPLGHTASEDVKWRNYKIHFRTDPGDASRAIFEVRKFFETAPHDEGLVVLIRVQARVTRKELLLWPLVRLAEGTEITGTSPKMENGSCHGFAFRNIGKRTVWLGMRGVIEKTVLERWAREKKRVEFLFNQHHDPPIPGPVPDIATFSFEPGAVLKELKEKQAAER